MDAVKLRCAAALVGGLFVFAASAAAPAVPRTQPGERANGRFS
jgi:hypothetical protein